MFGLRSYGSSAYLINKRLSVSNSPNTQLEIERATQAKRLAQALAAEEIESVNPTQESVTTNYHKLYLDTTTLYFLVFSVQSVPKNREFKS